MAFCDYHACDCCGERKTFYDANMNFEDQPDGSYTYDGHRVFALCHECAKTHEIVIQVKPGRVKAGKVGEDYFPW